MPRNYLTGSKSLLTLTFIKCMLSCRKLLQQSFSLPKPQSFFCWTCPFNTDLLAVQGHYLCSKVFHVKQMHIKYMVFPTYCAGSELHWSLADTCRCNRWRCRPWKIRWPHMSLCCGKGLGGKDLYGNVRSILISCVPQLQYSKASLFYLKWWLLGKVSQ